MTLDHYNEPRRVLLMGEDRLSLRVLGSLLAEHGFEIVGDAMTEHAALELLGERATDVAVLDLHRSGGTTRAARLAGGFRMAADGEAFISAAAAAELLARLRAAPRAWETFPPSTRELQIVRLTARECDVPEIARELTLSERLVRKHLCNMLRKLQLADRIADAVRAAHRLPIAYSVPRSIAAD